LHAHFVEEADAMQDLPMSTLSRCEENEREELKEVFGELHRSFIGRPDELIPMLQAVQNALGYLPEEAFLEIARMVKVPAASVFGIATFYSQFRLQPVGRHIIRICTGTACHVRGSHRILNDVESRLHVEPNGTTDDRLFTLQTVACFGACALAPVIVVDESVKGRMNPSKALGIVEFLGNEEAAVKMDTKPA
jgi:NADH-quinone oxidoreductase subunit E